METRTEIIKAKLANGAIVHIQATAPGGEEEVAFTLPSFFSVPMMLRPRDTVFLKC